MERRQQVIYVLLFLYIGVSFTYQVAGSVFLITKSEIFSPKNQVQPPFQLNFATGRVSNTSIAAKQAGVMIGDRLDSIDGVPYLGLSQWQRVQYHAHVGGIVQVGMRHSDDSYLTASIPFEKAFVAKSSFGEQIFYIFVQIIVPLFCLGLGYWVAVVRPMDPNAWFVLVLLSFPEIFVSVSTLDWPPGFWLALRLYWHLILYIPSAAALLWLGLLFPERSRIDVRLPWLKWSILSLFAFGLGLGLFTEYINWYDQSLIANRAQVDAINDSMLRWTGTLCMALYWVAIFGKLRTASSADSRRRLRVLCIGSSIGLGSILVIFGALPWFGLSTPTDIHWLAVLSAVLMLTFPLSVAYVVIVQRALDVRVLLRMGTKYALARTTLVIIEIAAAAFLLVYFVIPAIRTQRGGTLHFILPVLAIAGIIALLVARERVSRHFQTWLDRKFFREAYNAELVLSELAERVRTIADVPTMIGTVAGRISEILHIPQIAVLLRSGEMFQVQHTIGLDLHDATVMLPVSSLSTSHEASGSTPAVIHSRQGRPLLGGDAGSALLDKVPAEAILLLPGRTRIMGLMTLGPKLSEETYSPSDLRLLESLAMQTGLGLEVGDLARSLAEEAAQRERMQREIEIASEVQQRLFPQCTPEFPGIDLAGDCRPALGVGGDYYDMFKTSEGCLALALGDVSGKGISAALLMASLRASLRSIADEGCDDLARIMTKLNKQVHDASAASRYATFFFAVYKPNSGELRYVNAGHNPPFIIRDGCEAVPLEAGGMVVGLLPDTEYTEGVTQLQAGDLLLTYTDGISEAMTEQDEEWGEARMLAAAVAARILPAKQILQQLMRSADEFTRGAPQHDDMTLMVLKVGSVDPHPPV